MSKRCQKYFGKFKWAVKYLGGVNSSIFGAPKSFFGRQVIEKRVNDQKGSQIFLEELWAPVEILLLGAGYPRYATVVV